MPVNPEYAGLQDLFLRSLKEAIAKRIWRTRSFVNASTPYIQQIDEIISLMSDEEVYILLDLSLIHI